MELQHYPYDTPTGHNMFDSFQLFINNALDWNCLNIKHAGTHWLHLNYMREDGLAYGVEASQLYEEYCRDFCQPARIEPKGKAELGKLVRVAFPHVKKRRLGPAGHQVSYYFGIIPRPQQPQHPQHPQQLQQPQHPQQLQHPQQPQHPQQLQHPQQPQQLKRKLEDDKEEEQQQRKRKKIQGQDEKGKDSEIKNERENKKEKKREILQALQQGGAGWCLSDELIRLDNFFLQWAEYPPTSGTTTTILEYEEEEEEMYIDMHHI